MSHPQQASGYRFGGGNFVGAVSHAPTTPDQAVAGVSFATVGYEVLDRRDAFVSWHDCVLDACDALKRRVVGKVVRCSDRALLKVCKPARRW